MNIQLLDFQEEYVSELLEKLKKSKRHVKEGDLEAVLLSAPTGSGKTVMITSTIEKILFGTETFESERDAVFLWISDQPELNEQSRNRILEASSLLLNHHLVIVDSDFDQELFDGGRIYFLNTQKLGRDKNLTTKGDSRSYTIWETIENTAKKLVDRFYVIIDEAHRGMNRNSSQETEARTIVQKFLLGSKEISPVKLVIGISATPERFERLVSGSERHLYKVSVDIVKVRESGLLKERLIVRVPKDSQPNNWSLLAAAAKRWSKMRDEWNEYCKQQHIPTVSPIMLIQVEDGSRGNLTNTNLQTVIETLENTLGKIKDEELAHCFDIDKDIETSTHKIRRLDPSKVSADLNVKFVFFKMALTTGWDCPRAEVMMSFRHAQDATLIAQLVGRMIRTPLARKIEGSETLNEVHLYLPYYNQDNLKAVIDKLQGDSENVPTTEVKVDSDLYELTIPESMEAVHATINGLPTYTFKGRQLTNLKRLMKFSNYLSVIDAIDREALPSTKKLIIDILTEKKYRLLQEDQNFRSTLDDLSVVTINPLILNPLSNELVEGEAETIEINERNIEDLFRISKQRLGSELCLEYLRLNFNEEEPYKAKIELYLLLQNKDLWDELESFSLVRLRQLKDKNYTAINTLESSKRQRYDEVWASGRNPEEGSLYLPKTVTIEKCANGKEYQKHLFLDENGKFKANLNTWESIVIEKEINNCFAWMRNVSRKPWALSYKYESNNGWKPGYPDFLVVRKIGDGLVVDILEPHNESLADSLEKAKGLAYYADLHGTRFGRIEMQRIEDGKIIRLDFNDPEIRQRALRLSSNQELYNLFRELGKRENI
jgi:type III restriction enzyme